MVFPRKVSKVLTGEALFARHGISVFLLQMLDFIDDFHQFCVQYSTFLRKPRALRSNSPMARRDLLKTGSQLIDD